jgi:hypothetical protein
VASDGLIYVTESNVEEFIADPAQAGDARSYVTAVSPTGTVTRLITSEAVVSQVGSDVYIEFLSFSGLDWGADGLLYVANETSGLSETDTQSGLTYTVTTTKSIVTVNPISSNDALFSSNLVAVEGIRFTPGRRFPLWAAEEDLGNGSGRLSLVADDGLPAVVCTGFGMIEDVIADALDRLYVSEDVAGNGRVILLDKGSLRTLYLPLVQKP